jgi:hypothetical protein
MLISIILILFDDFYIHWCCNQNWINGMSIKNEWMNEWMSVYIRCTCEKNKLIFTIISAYVASHNKMCKMYLIVPGMQRFAASHLNISPRQWTRVEQVLLWDNTSPTGHKHTCKNLHFKVFKENLQRVMLHSKKNSITLSENGVLYTTLHSAKQGWVIKFLQNMVLAIRF